MRHIDENMLLAHGEGILHNASMSRSRQFSSNAVLQLRLEVSHLSSIFTNLCNIISQLHIINTISHCTNSPSADYKSYYPKH